MKVLEKVFIWFRFSCCEVFVVSLSCFIVYVVCVVGLLCRVVGVKLL